MIAFETVLSGAVWGSVVAVFVAAVAMVLPLRAYGGEPSVKATLLSRGISEAMNCGGLALAAAILAAGIGALARWRLGAGRQYR